MAQDRTIGVVGAGLIGVEIAFVFALAGYHVRLTDREPPKLDAALARLASIYDKGVTRGFHAAENHDATLARILPIATP